MQIFEYSWLIPVNFRIFSHVAYLLSVWHHGAFICIALYQLMQYQSFISSGGTALHAACEHGHVDVATSLLQHGAVVDSQDKVRLLYVSMVNMLCHRMVCSV